MNIVALLTARGNNTLKDKNLLKILDKPLIAYPCIESKRVMKISDYFNPSSDPSKNMTYEIGLLAQEVKETSEELDFDNKIVTVGDDEIHRMDYQKIMMPLIKAIQEQQKMIDDQQEMIRNLEHKINAIMEK